MGKNLDLSDFSFEEKKFKNIEKVFVKFKKKDFLKKNIFEKENFVNENLLHLILEEKNSFTFFNVLNYIERINNKKILKNYDLSSFEFWLNFYSKLSTQENYFIRAKIVGKYIPREEYQNLFPIAMNKEYEGSHIVTAHRSADLDSLITSFWSWVDAFAAKISSNLHVWNVPDGVFENLEIELFFKKIFGKKVFDFLLKTDSSLNLSSKDLLSLENLIIKKEDDTTSIIDHKRHHNAVVVIDNKGYYVGEWRSFDVEDITAIISLLTNVLKWFKTKVQLDLIALFAKVDFDIKDIKKFAIDIFKIKIKDISVLKRYTLEQKKYLDLFLKKVLKVKIGITSSFQDLANNLEKISLMKFKEIFSFLCGLKEKDFYHNQKENRVKIFKFFDKIIKKIKLALEEIEIFLQRMDIALKIKSDVFEYKPCYVSISDDVDEIKDKMGPNQFLSVIIEDENYKKIPIGIIKASDLKKNYLGTVSFRDFSNKKEIKIAPYLDVISVIDHHKIEGLNSSLPPFMLLSDAQATATILAKQVMGMNEKYSSGGISKEDVEMQIKKEKNIKILKRLIQKKIVLSKEQDFFIHPEREFLEYFHFLYAILDDTDLLTKVSNEDVLVVAKLLNKMKSILMKKEMEIINLDGIAEDENFAKKASQIILQNEDMYLLYKKIYQQKEKEIEKNIILCAKNKPSSIFIDTKIQNGFSMIGQLKIFFKNVKYFEKYKNVLRKKWIEKSKKAYKEREEIELHLHMISTIRSADEVFKSYFVKYKHKDELWIWICEKERAWIHLKKFLLLFLKFLQEKDKNFEVEIFGKETQNLEKVFYECQVPFKTKKTSTDSFAVIKYMAGTVNSRKAMISPYLPKAF